MSTQIASAVAAAVIFTLLLQTSSSSCFKSIISFGDSLTDTGNLIRLNPLEDIPTCGKPPYGLTFFHRPTGRSSDGRLVVDFMAEMLELPYVKPYLGGDKENNFSGGVNFAVGGGKALGDANGSLATQFEWFKRFYATLSDGKEFLQRSLVVVGEIGGNDYNSLISDGRSLEEIKPLVPQVVNLIGDTIEKLIKHGAETILVPDIVPLGCLSYMLNKLKSSDQKYYDPQTGCIVWLNHFTEYHNELLIKKVDQLQHLHPDVNIIHADYYNAAALIYRSPEEFGFPKENILKACCGGGGVYNSDITCGHLGVKPCDDPSLFAIWDGIHFTEAFYKRIAQGLFEGPYTKPRLKLKCSKDCGRVYEY